MVDSNMDTYFDNEMAHSYEDCDKEISLTPQLTEINNLINNFEDSNNTTIAEDEEYESKDFIIKEEFEIGEEGIMNTNSLSHSHTLECIPIVYTKRLDEMTIFKKKINDQSFSNIVQKVILESKPNLKNTFKLVPERKATINKRQFSKLENKILKLNKLATLNKAPSENIIDLVDDVDSVNVVESVPERKPTLNELQFFKLEDESLNLNKLTTLNIAPSENTVDLVDDVDSVNVLKSVHSNDSEEEMPLRVLSSKKTQYVDMTVVNKHVKEDTNELLKLCKPCCVTLLANRNVSIIHGESFLIYGCTKKAFIKGLRYTIGVDCTHISFRNFKTNTSHVYIFEKKSLVYRKYDYIVSYDKSRNSLLELNVDECCYNNRENVIKSLIYPKSMILDLLRIPHCCPQDQCKCCCKPITNFPEVFPVTSLTGDLNANKPNKTIKKQVKNDLKAINILPNDFDFIHKALNYTPKSYNDSSNEKEITDLPEVDDRLGIKILKDYSEMAEFYKFTLNGKSIKYIQMDPLVRNVKNDCFKNDIQEFTRSDIVLCCWHKCDELIRSLELKRIPTVRQFVRTRHPCPPNNCICCCKPNLPQPVHNEEALKPASNHATNYTSIIKKRCKFLAKRKELKSNQILQDNNLNDYENIILPQLVSKQTLSNPKQPLRSIEPTQFAHNMPINPQINNTDATINPNPPQINYTIATGNPNMPKMNKRLNSTFNPSVSLENNTSDATVNMLVNSILQRFSNVRLTITPAGNVSAELNTPVHTLSTMELQILSSILNRAKQQVAELKAKGHWNPDANTEINPVGSMNFGNGTNPRLILNLSDNTTPTTTSDNTSVPKAKVSTTCSKVATPQDKTYKGPEVINRQARRDAFQCYTNISALKMKEYLASCKYLLGNLNYMPKITEVFSKNPCVQTQVNNDKAKTNENLPMMNTTNEQPKYNNAMSSKKSKVAEAKTNVDHPIINTTYEQSKNNKARPSKKSKVTEAINTSSTEGQVKRKNTKENVKSNKNISGTPAKRRRISKKMNSLEPTVTSSENIVTIDLDDDPLTAEATTIPRFLSTPNAAALPSPYQIVTPGNLQAPMLSNLLNKPDVPPGAPNRHVPNLVYVPVPVMVPNMPIPRMPIPSIPIRCVPDVPIDATGVELTPDVQKDPIMVIDTTIDDDDCILGF